MRNYKQSFEKISLAINQTFPFRNKSEIRKFEESKRNYQNMIAQASNDTEFFDYVRIFLNSLDNSHTKLSGYPGIRFYSPSGYSALMQNKDFFLFKNMVPQGQILKINNKKPDEILDYWLRRVDGTTPWLKESKALRLLLDSTNQSNANIIIKRGNIKKTLHLKRHQKTQNPPKSISGKILPGKVGLLKISTWTDEKVTAEIKSLLKYFSVQDIQGLIIDVRGNGGGNSNYADKLSGHFFKEGYSDGSFQIRKNKTSYQLESGSMNRTPRKPYYSWPVVILIDRNCFSSNEIFIASMRDNGRAVLIGERTGGGSGNPKKFTIPLRESGFDIFVSTWIYYRPNGELIEKKGITPDIEVTNDIFSGKDLVLEKAREYFKTRK